MVIETLRDVRSGGHRLVAICRNPTCRHRQLSDVDRLINSVGPSQQLLPARSELHFTDRMRCPSCKRRGMSLWVDYVPPKAAPSPARKTTVEPNYRVIDQGSTHPYGSTVIATADNLMVARAAYAAAVHFYGDHWITLLQGAFVIADSKQDGPPEVMQAEEYRSMRAAEASMGKIDRAAGQGVPPVFSLPQAGSKS
jgi:hypothetical protein